MTPSEHPVSGKYPDTNFATLWTNPPMKLC
uniref:Uncharacterized protein n=1 Tax=Arundo donax TaxID=35708 RepID=A0A0A9C8F2_ARUDO